MDLLNIEIKAHSNNLDEIRKILKKHDAEYKGLDRQVDTYFNIDRGRLKLREGNIEQALIYYQRPDRAGPKQSDVILYETTEGDALKKILAKVLGISIVVDKKREIYFIQNVKFHLDVVEGLGSFVEIEAIDNDGTVGSLKLLEQCKNYMVLFGIEEAALIKHSYSDLLLAKR